MNALSVFEKLKAIDIAMDRDQFYYELCRKMVLLTAQERSAILDWVRPYRDRSPKDSACFAFSEGMASLYVSDFPKMLSSLELSSGMFRQIGHKGGQMATAMGFCVYYRSMGQLDKAQNSVHQALNFLPEVPMDDVYSYFKAVTHYQAAEISVELKNDEGAIDHYITGLNFSHDNNELKGRILSGLGVLYMSQEKWEQAISHLEEALDLIRHQNNIVLESKILADIGSYYHKIHDLERAFENQQKSLKLRLDNGMTSAAITNYLRLSELSLVSGNVPDAIRYGHLSQENSERLKVNIKLYESHLALAQAYEAAGDISRAYEHFKLFSKLKEEVHGQQVTRKIEQMKGQHKLESAQQEKEIFRLRNVELKAALDEIKESFRYAKRIQTAILPPAKLMEQVFPDSFVLFKPKDIVSGDFYWLEMVDEKVLIAAVDCTGHGVPGAMVSLVGNNCLNRAVHGFGLTRPSDILDKLTVLVERTFMHKDAYYAEDEIKDGMDISLCCIDLKERKMQWAGANNPLWLMRNGQISEITANKQPIGKFDNRLPFTSHEILLAEGDCFYLFTDGYADQFGGPAGKKFKYKQLKELLEANAHMKMAQQKEVLEKRFSDWQGQLEQIDDVCIIGLRI